MMTATLHRVGIALSGAMLVAFAAIPQTAYSAKPGGGGTTTTCDPAKANSFAARAYSILLDSNVLGTDVDVGPVPDTGEVPATGGMLDATAIAVDSPSSRLTVSASVLHNTAVGSGDRSNAFSSVVGLNLALNDGVSNILSVNAGVLQASSTIKCSGGSKTPDAKKTGANIVGLTLNLLDVPIDIPANAPPNTALVIPPIPAVINGASIILNEQFPDPVTGRQVVNAVHIKLDLSDVLGILPLAKVDLVISHAEVDVTCGSGANPNCNCPVKDFVTGGGFITLANGGKGTFGFVGGLKANGYQGNLTYSDHSGGGAPKQVKGRGVTAYSVVGSTTPTRTVTYACTYQDFVVSGGCVLKVSDFGEPGGGVDEFGIKPDSLNAPFGKITHGNIQLHTPNCAASTTSTGGPKHGR